MGTVALLAVVAGYDVALSNSRGPQTLTDLVEELGTPRGAEQNTSRGALPLYGRECPPTMLAIDLEQLLTAHA